MVELPDSETMTCMDVWGGNEATERAVEMLGLQTWVYSRPYQGAAGGGDVYFASSCATGRITRLLIADVSGHGAKVASIASSLRQLMRKHVNHIEQTRFVAQMNSEFEGLRHSGGFATAVAATFFSPEQRLTITNAGHPPPLIFRQSRGEWEVWQDSDKAFIAGPADLPLGVLGGIDYAERREVLQKGDLVLMYTDSLIESRHRDGSLLQIEGLLNLMQTLDASTPATLIPQLLQALQNLNSENLGDDDVTALLMRVTGTGGTVPVLNRLAAPFRFLWGCGKAMVRGESLPLPEFTWANLGGSLIDPVSERRHSVQPEKVPPVSPPV